ncbi:polysaccharide biosynthesis protein [Flavobacterium psychrophilum]|uniref:polysaccharide biosynthesis protein n=1 Tax=Flavobacterium psychrophilum TaxID=96345 RepID=UPI000B7C1DF3|nr:nucleoside-diphosphate sugar epimerase/dehydratase [Flavobacterium psychrophilum]SNB10314.1 WbpM protein involved in UDP-D-Qui2NAc biosynthesis (A nucleotide sugar for antigen-O biosynthesis) [Flavobacterium psychrophilum]
MEIEKKKIIQSALQQIYRYSSKSNFTIRNLGYLPRWIILFIDIGVISMAGFLTFYLFKGIGLQYFASHNEGCKFVLFFVTNIFFFWWFRTYSGIIRHSSFIDAIKILFSQFFTFLVLVVFNFLFSIYFNDDLFLNTALVVNVIISFCLLFLYRVLVKQFFESYLKGVGSTKLVRAIVYGSDANAISVSNALISEIPMRFKLLGFIDKHNSNSTKRILDLPILNQKKRIPVLMRSMHATALIIADKALTKEEQIAIVDECLEFNIKVYTVPLISDWENQEEIAKKIKSFQIEDLLERKPIVLDNKLISSQIKGKVILITGAAGSIGSEIVRQIICFSPDILIVLDQAETPLHELTLEIQKLNLKTKLVSLVADVRNLVGLDRIFDQYRPSLVYHAAAYKHVPLMEENPSQAIFVNVMGTKNLADLSLKYNVEKFVMVSTDKAVNPSNVMGASKRIAEKYVQSLYFENKNNPSYTTKFITTRFGNVLGSNGSVVPLFSKQIAEGGPITITHKDIIRYFMTIPEACQLVLEAGAMGQGGEIYIFDMGKPVRIYDLATKMIRLAGFVPDKDIKIKIVGLRPGEKLYEELLNDNSKTLPTHHEKIMVAQEQIEVYHEVQTAILEIIKASNAYDNNLIVTKMKMLIPEFKSMNSTFEMLDN